MALRAAGLALGLAAAGLTDVELTPTHAVGHGLHGAIIRAVKPADWSPDRVRPIDLPRPAASLPMVRASDGCCGDGCGCS